jgi:serine/threonine-protein kinase HipA
MNGILAGTICEEAGEGYTFVYDREYFENPSRPAISLTMPKKTQTYRSRHLFPFFANMLSEGSNRAVQAKFHRVDILDDFGILLATAGIDTPGAITVKRVDND